MIILNIPKEQKQFIDWLTESESSLLTGEWVRIKHHMKEPWEWMDAGGLALRSGVGLAQGSHCTSLASVRTSRLGILVPSAPTLIIVTHSAFPRNSPRQQYTSLNKLWSVGLWDQQPESLYGPTQVQESNVCVSKDSYCKIKSLQP